MKVKWFLLVVAVLLLGFVFMPRGLNFTPLKLMGTWRTECPSHADRFFRITESTIVFNTGGYDVDIYFISNVEEQAQGSETVYEIEFHKEGQAENTLTLLFDPSPPERIAFENQRHRVWLRSSEDEV